MVDQTFHKAWKNDDGHFWMLVHPSTKKPCRTTASTFVDCHFLLDIRFFTKVGYVQRVCIEKLGSVTTTRRCHARKFFQSCNINHMHTTYQEVNQLPSATFAIDNIADLVFEHVTIALPTQRRYAQATRPLCPLPSFLRFSELS
eukprot:m.221944 g.221944  ORF g.221944 m.221944 type:complete len:144 (+) comp17252_c0_seq36:1196-1627(+)